VLFCSQLRTHQSRNNRVQRYILAASPIHHLPKQTDWKCPPSDARAGNKKLSSLLQKKSPKRSARRRKSRTTKKRRNTRPRKSRHRVEALGGRRRRHRLLLSPPPTGPVARGAQPRGKACRRHRARAGEGEGEGEALGQRAVGRVSLKLHRKPRRHLHLSREKLLPELKFRVPRPSRQLLHREPALPRHRHRLLLRHCRNHDSRLLHRRLLRRCRSHVSRLLHRCHDPNRKPPRLQPLPQHSLRLPSRRQQCSHPRRGHCD
jgi:hypothetical protein